MIGLKEWKQMWNNQQLQIGMWSQGNLPSKIKVNPMEHCKAIILKSGKEIGQKSRKIEVSKNTNEVVDEIANE